MTKEKSFFEDKMDCSVYGVDEEWELCDHCKWQDIVSDEKPPCCYCSNYDLQYEIPKEFDYNKLKEKYNIK